MIEDDSLTSIDLTHQQYQEILNYHGVLAIVLYMVEMIAQAAEHDRFTKSEVQKMFYTLAVPCIGAFKQFGENHPYYDKVAELHDLIEERTENLEMLTLSDVPMLLDSIRYWASIEMQAIYALTISP